MAGGTERQLVELLSQLDRRAFDPHVVCLYGERAGRSLHFLPALQALEVPVTVLDLSWSGIDKLRGTARLARLIRNIQPDVIHALNYHSNGLARLACLILRSRVPLITSMYVDYTRKQLIYERLSGWRDALCVCNTLQIQAQLRSALPNRPTELIYNGIDQVRFSPLNRSFEGSSVVLVGRIARQKAAHVFVEAIGLLKQRGDLPANFQATIVGECSELSAQQLVDQMVQRYQLGDRVCQLSAIDHVEDYFRTSVVSVLPSLWEGLPNAILKSLACGCPVIVSESANQAGVVQHGITGWVVPDNNAEALAVALQEALNLPIEVREQMSLVCRASVSSFMVTAMAQKYEQIYQSLSRCS